jgi:hypothetical protein
VARDDYVCIPGAALKKPKRKARQKPKRKAPSQEEGDVQVDSPTVHHAVVNMGNRAMNTGIVVRIFSTAAP